MIVGTIFAAVIAVLAADADIARRRAALRGEVPPSKAIHVVMVTDGPMRQNAWSKEIVAFITADDLFCE